MQPKEVAFLITFFTEGVFMDIANRIGFFSAVYVQQPLVLLPDEKKNPEPSLWQKYFINSAEFAFDLGQSYSVSPEALTSQNKKRVFTLPNDEHFAWKVWRGFTLAAITIIFPLGFFLLGIKACHHKHDFDPSMQPVVQEDKSQESQDSSLESSESSEDSSSHGLDGKPLAFGLRSKEEQASIMFADIKNKIEKLTSGDEDKISIGALECYDRMSVKKQIDFQRIGYSTNIETLTSVYVQLAKEFGQKPIDQGTHEFSFSYLGSYYILEFSNNMLFGTTNKECASLEIRKVRRDDNIPSNIEDAKMEGYIPYEFYGVSDKLESVQKAYGLQYLQKKHDFLAEDRQVTVDNSESLDPETKWCIVLHGQKSGFESFWLQVSVDIVVDIDTGMIYKKFTINNSGFACSSSGDYDKRPRFVYGVR